MNKKLMNKKLIIFIGGILLLGGLVLFIFLFLGKPSPKEVILDPIKPVVIEDPELIDPLETGKEEAVPPVTANCPYENDKSAYKIAIKEIDFNACVCIENAVFEKQCQTVVSDLNFYSEAIKQFDVNLCNQIKEGTKKSACLLIVKSGVEHLEENDLDYLASIHLVSHNEAAIDNYGNLLENDPENLLYLTSLSVAYAEKGLKAQEQGLDRMPYIEKAFEIINKAKEFHPTHTEVYRAEAYIYEIKPDLYKALELYNKSIELDETNLLSYTGKGHLHRMLGLFEEAVKDFNKAAELDVDQAYVSIYTNLCHLEASRGNNDAAMKNCKIVIAESDSDPLFRSNAYKILSTLYLKNQNLSAAQSSMLKAKSLAPNNSNLYITSSKLRLLETDYFAAEVDARKSIKLTPTKAASYLSLSQSLYMQEKYRDSIFAAEQGLKLVQDDVSLLLPAKPAFLRDLNHSIANNYRQLGNTKKTKEYEAKAKEAFSNPQFEVNN